MATTTPSYGNVATITITLAGLASDATNVTAGRESNSVDNTSDLADDSLVGGKVMTGTSPTANRVIEFWAIGSYDGTTFGGNATGSDANLTPPSKSSLALLTVLFTNSTSNQSYTWGPCSIAQAFGGTMPKKWSIFCVHNTGAALNATGGNFEVKYTPVKYVAT